MKPIILTLNPLGDLSTNTLTLYFQLIAAAQLDQAAAAFLDECRFPAPDCLIDALLTKLLERGLIRIRVIAGRVQVTLKELAQGETYGT